MKKICENCKEEFARKVGYSAKQWAETRFCSRSCMGSKWKSERPALQRFFSFVEIDPITRCWNWTGGKDQKGYGMFERTRSHRFIFKTCVADIPHGMLVLHRCDNPTCSNPLHLFLGTTQDNMDDMYLKGRANHVRGEATGAARLTESQVYAIRDDPRFQSEIARDYGIAQTTVSAIKRRANWPHLHERRS